MLKGAPDLDQHYLNRDARKPTMLFPNRCNTNRAVQPQKVAIGLKFQIKKVEGLYYPRGENKGADQLRDYREADVHLCFRMYVYKT